MKVLVTGAKGIVGSAMIKYLKSRNIDTVEWDRKKVSPFDYNQMKSFIESVKPDILLHFAIASQGTGAENESWRINYEWTSELAWITRELGIKFLFTSTAMVFSDNAKGPFTISTVPDAKEGYGYEKLKAEERAVYQNPESFICRLGWQIGDTFEGNNMLAYLEKQYLDSGVINASTKWYPACSFVEDTVAEIYRIVTLEKPGLFMIDSNDRYTFYDIASYLNKMYKRGWKIEPDEKFIFEQRMCDYKCLIPKLSAYIEKINIYDRNKYRDAGEFHSIDQKIYVNEDSRYFKESDGIVTVKYSPAHENSEYNDERRGRGSAYVKWIYSEQEKTKEGIVSENLLFVHDTFLEPYGVIGEHRHIEDEEIYYILDGNAEIHVTDTAGQIFSKILSEGDGHLIKRGEKHYIKAGKHGARFMVIGIK